MILWNFFRQLCNKPRTPGLITEAGIWLASVPLVLSLLPRMMSKYNTIRTVLALNNDEPERVCNTEVTSLTYMIRAVKRLQIRGVYPDLWC